MIVIGIFYQTYSPVFRFQVTRIQVDSTFEDCSDGKRMNLRAYMGWSVLLLFRSFRKYRYLLVGMVIFTLTTTTLRLSVSVMRHAHKSKVSLLRSKGGVLGPRSAYTAGTHNLCDCSRLETFLLPPIPKNIIPSNSSSQTEFISKISLKNLNKFQAKQQPPLVEATGTGIYMLSAVGRNFTYGDPWEHISVNTWLTKDIVKEPVQCCLLYRSGNLYRTTSRQKSVFIRSNLTASKVLCSRDVFPYWENDLPLGVSLSLSDCQSELKYYIKPVYPLKDDSACSFAICLKVAYGHVNPQLILEWLEYHKNLGVSRVLVFTYQISAEADAVFRLYQQLGFVERLLFDYPLKKKRGHQLGNKDPDGWTDEQVPVFDCQDRLHGFKYIAVIDLDEFVAPKQHSSICDMMKLLTHKHPYSSTFYLPVEIHALDWGMNITLQSALIPQYTQKSPLTLDRLKNIHLPKYIVAGGLTTHNAPSCDGCKMSKVRPQYAVLKHYRSCRPEWLKSNSCWNVMTYTDFYMRDRFRMFESQLQEAKHQLQNLSLYN